MRAPLPVLVLLLGCARPGGFEFEAEIAAVSGSPFGLTDEQHRGAGASGAFGWDRRADDLDDALARGEFPTDGRGPLVVNLPDGIVLRGSDHALVVVMERSLQIQDGIDEFQVGRPVLVGDAEDRSVRLELGMSHDSLRFDPEVLPPELPDYDDAAWSHTFSIQQGEATLLLRFTRLRSPQEPLATAADSR
jgi:hypothetical protein